MKQLRIPRAMAASLIFAALVSALLWTLAGPKTADAQGGITNFDTVVLSGDLVVGDDVTVGGTIAAAAFVTSGNLTLPGTIAGPTGVLTVTGDLYVSDDGTIADDFTVGDDATVNDLFVSDWTRIVPQSVVTVTMNGIITPTGSFQKLSAAGGVGTASIAAGTAGDVLVLYNTANQSIVLSDTGTLKLTGNITLGQYDSLTLVSDGTNWVQLSTANN